MTAGLPGTGLGGLFFIILGLTMPIVEAARTVMGRSSLERWKIVLHQFCLAVAIVVAIDRLFWAAGVVLDFGPDEARRGLVDGAAVPITPVVLSIAVLAWLLAVASLLRHLVRPAAPAASDGLTRPPAAADLPVPTLVD
jgi:hypothetical protein